MRVQFEVPASKGKSIKASLGDHVQSWESEEWGDEFEAIILIDPGSFRFVDDTLRSETKGQATLDVLSVAVIEEEESTE